MLCKRDGQGMPHPCEYQPSGWRHHIHSTWWYKASSFTYCVIGLITVLHPHRLVECAPVFPFRLLGVLVVANGITSYMGDVHTWGDQSHWKSVDILLAHTNVALQCLLIVMGLTGVAAFPLSALGVHAVGVGVALLCKRLAEEALEPHEYMKYHALWHLVLPVSALISGHVLV